jgi:hypothetical protein
MSDQNKNEVKKETGIEVETVTFDEKGEVVGLDQEVLDSVAGGLLADDNTGCGNSVNGSCK